MSKSLCTWQCYAKSFKNQTQLDQFFHTHPSTSMISQVQQVSDCSISSAKELEQSVEFIGESHIFLDDNNWEVSVGLSTVPESELTIGTPSGSHNPPSDDELSDNNKEIISQNWVEQEEEVEAWEKELEQDINNHPIEIKDWAALHTQIKANLTKNVKKLALSQINKLMIICNFATLHLKGWSCIAASLEIAAQWHEWEGVWFSWKVCALARHYQIFKQLPVESCSGLRNAHSLLKDELVKKQILNYLQSLLTGKVTPKALQVTVNTVILPGLGITPKKPISTCTAQRWLIKLGWRYPQVKKGVYMDGHEQADVVKYCQEEFLPLMAKFEACMAHYEGPELTQVVPTLQPREWEIIPNFYNESTFHANEEVRSVWLHKGEQPLCKKRCGCLIHISAFVNPETGCLVLLDKKGDVVWDSTKIIYPGSGGDPWWDCTQLLKEMEDAIQIFEAAHLGKQSLFIFDQSSAHVSLPPDTLKAFEMNKYNGGKQWHQHDTIILDTNPVEEHCGKCSGCSVSNEFNRVTHRHRAYLTNFVNRGLWRRSKV